ncbi:MAG: 50S ribosomal protein L11 methyltransferase [Longimicrobiales bacterium]
MKSGGESAGAAAGPEHWLVLSVRVPAENQIELLVETLIALGGSAVEESAEWLTTYLPQPANLARCIERARRRLESAVNEGLELHWQTHAAQDWSETWKRGLAPRRVGKRLIVVPSWTRARKRRGDVVLSIDPGMAFGTGEHASTRGVLRLLESSVKPRDRVLDIGTGTAILAIAAIRLGGAHVLAFDADAQALAVARTNTVCNRVDAAIELRHGRVDARLLASLGAGSFDLITANVLSGVLVPLLPALATTLAPRGRLILGGILRSEADALAHAAEAAGLRVVHTDVEEDWWSALLGPFRGTRVAPGSGAPAPRQSGSGRARRAPKGPAA